MTAEEADPRVERTRAHVLAHARALLADEGPTGLTYSALAKRARVTRQTLYRHWPGLDALLADLVLDAAMAKMPGDVTGSPGEIVSAFLRRLRDDIAEPAHAGPLTALVSLADHDEASARAVARVQTEVRAALNRLLEPAGAEVTADDYDRLCGAVLFRRFFAREPVTDAFVDDLVAAWSRGGPSRSDLT